MLYAEVFLIGLTLIWYEIFMVAENVHPKNTFWGSTQIWEFQEFSAHSFFTSYHFFIVIFFNNLAYFFRENIQSW